MFDLSFAEIIVIAVVALIVVGPERLPKVARTAGVLLGRVQRYVSDVKSDISRELELEELKKLQRDVQQQARQFESSIRSEIEKTESSLENAVSEVRSEVAALESEVGALQLAGQEEAAPVAEARAQPVEKFPQENALPLFPDALSPQEREAQLAFGFDDPVVDSEKRMEKP